MQKADKPSTHQAHTRRRRSLLSPLRPMPLPTRLSDDLAKARASLAWVRVGARRCWRVSDPRQSEKIVHEAVD
jgi:hypothetical protein